MMQPIYQKISNHYSKWWCNSHQRVADYIIIGQSIRIVCNPSLGGIMIPCECEKYKYAD